MATLFQVNQREQMAHKVNVGLICSGGLGDTLVQMIVANNLATNGYEVVFYSNHGYQLRDHVRGYQVREFPAETELKKEFEEHDVILYDQGSSYVRSLAKHRGDWLKNSGIGYSMSATLPATTSSHYKEKILRQSVSNGVANQIKRLLAFNRPVRATSKRPFYRQTMVDQVVYFLRHSIGLDHVSKQTGLVLQGCANRTDSRKIIIHPTSSDFKKNWSLHNYIQLARWLERDGFEPVITVSPSERPKWLEHVTGQFDVPLFDSVLDLALFYCDAAWFIGNDSGNAHVASCVGLPTFQIFSRWRHHPSWRAGWAENRVITATFPANLSRTNWQAGLAPEKVYKSFVAWYKLYNNKQQPNLITG